MRKQLSDDEVFRLITECRQSGLSDYQWCKDNQICPSTFYTWIKRLKRKDYAVESARNNSLPYVQEVIQLNPSHNENVRYEKKVEQNTPIRESTVPAVVMEISTAGSTIRFYSGVSQELVRTAFLMLGGGDH